MTKKQAKIFARIHTGISATYTDALAFMDNNGNHGAVPEKDQIKCVDACNELGYKIIGNLPEITSSIDIYKYVIANH